MRSDSYSFRGGEQILTERGLWSDLEQMVSKMEEMGDTEAVGTAADLGWDTEVEVVGEGIAPRDFSWKYDAYKDGVAIEFERGQQVKMRWNWIKFQLGYEGVPASKVDTGVLLITKSRGQGAVSRCKRELESNVFNNVLNLTVPMVIAEFED